MTRTRCTCLLLAVFFLFGSAGIAQAAPEAFLSITPSGDIHTSTFGTGSFMLRNDSSAGEEIVRFRLDLTTALLPDLVYDPDGTAGDPVGKCFSPVGSEADATGMEEFPDKCVDPFSAPLHGGYQVLEVDFTDFEPGEMLTFAVDNDPTSVKGSTHGNAEPGASISGLELTASTLTVEFSSGEIVVTNPFRTAGSVSGSENLVRPGGPSAPGIEVLGVPVTPRLVSDASQTVRITGAPGEDVRLLVVEASFEPGDAPGGGFDVDPFEANTAILIREFTATVGGSGSLDFPITLTKSADNAGYNHLVAVFEDGSGRTSPTSNVLVLQLGDACKGPALVAPDITCEAGVPCDLFIDLDSDGASVASLAATVESSAGIACDSSCDEGSAASNGSCSINSGSCVFNVADLSAPITAFGDGEVAELSVTCSEPGIHALNLSDVSMGSPGGGPISSPCGISGSVTCLGDTGDVQVDQASTVSACESASGDSITLPAVSVADLPDRILVVTAGGEEDDGDCDLGHPSASATYGGQAMQKAVTSVSDTSTWRTCNAIFYLLDPPAGSADVVVTFPTTVGNPINNRQAGAMVIFNAAQEAPEAVAVGGGDPTANPLVTSISPSALNGHVVDVATWGNTGAQTAFGGQTKRWGQSCGSSSSASSTKLAPAGNVSLGWSHANANRAAHSLAAFAPVEASGPVCGDGAIDAGEQCDDGNLTDGDGCDSNCTDTACGNGVVTAGEQCDDGGTAGEDGCSATCQIESCGDGIVQAGLGELCDDGAANSDSQPDACRTNCTPAACGDAVTDSSEECDDGNGAAGDGCTAGCILEECGDGVVQPALGEQCDDGNLTGGDCCSAACQVEAGCGPSEVLVDAGSVASVCEGTGGDSLSFAATVGSQSDRVLVVSVGAEENDVDCDLSAATVSYGGQAMALAVSSVSDLNTWRTCNGIFYLPAPPAGTANVDVQFSTATGNSINNRHATAFVIHNAAQTAPESIAAAGGDPTANPIVTPIATSSDNALIVDTVVHGNTGTEIEGAGQAKIDATSCASSASATSTKLVASAGATSMAWTHSNANRAAHAIAVFAAAAGGGPTTSTTSTTSTTVTTVTSTTTSTTSTSTSTSTSTTSTTTTTLPECSSDPDCDDGDACTSDTCSAGSCQHTDVCQAGRVSIDGASITSACEGSAGNSIAFAATVGSQSDRVLVVTVGGEENDADCDLGLANVTYGGISMTPAMTATSDLTSWRTCNGIFYLSAPPTGTANVEIQFPNGASSSSINNRHAGAMVLYDASQDGPEIVSAGGGDPVPNPIVSATAASSAFAMAVDVVTHGNTGTHTAQAGQVERWIESCASSSSATSTKEIAAAGAADMGWSHSNANRGAHAIAVWAPALSLCGNGSLDAGEQCDDGAANSDVQPNACRTSCTLPTCGDHVLDSGEECDDGNTADNDGCDTTCTIEYCGDGVLQGGIGEQCDDGNGAPGDCCDELCVIESSPGCQPAAADIEIDLGSVVSACESADGDQITLPDVSVGTQPGRILIVTAGAEENNADCDFDHSSARAFYGDIPLEKAVGAVSDLSSYRACSGIFYLLNPPATTADVLVELPTEAGSLINDRQAAAFVIYNAAQLPPEAIASAGDDPSSSSVAANLTTIEPNAMVIDVITQGNTGTFDVATSGQDLLWQESCGSSSSAASSKILEAAGPTSLGWQHDDANRHSHALAAFTPASYACGIDTDCDDGNACTFDTCLGGQCFNDPQPNDGIACDDGAACTASDVCAAGTCTGQDTCAAGDYCNLATAACQSP